MNDHIERSSAPSAPIKYPSPVTFESKDVWAMLEFDSDVRRWFISESNVPGLCMEADAADELRQWIPDVMSLRESVK